MSLELTTFALSARRSTDWANGPTANAIPYSLFYCTAPIPLPMNTQTALTLDNRSGRVTIKCVLSVSVAISMAFFSLLDITCRQSQNEHTKYYIPGISTGSSIPQWLKGPHCSLPRHKFFSLPNLYYSCLPFPWPFQEGAWHLRHGAHCRTWSQWVHTVPRRLAWCHTYRRAAAESWLPSPVDVHYY